MGFEVHALLLHWVHWECYALAFATYLWRGDNEVHVINLTVRSGRLSAVQSNEIATIWYFPWNDEGLLRKQGKAK